MLKIGIPDLISPSYFPAVAAVDLGFFAAEGLDAEIELVVPVDRTMEHLRDGKISFVGGSAHSVPHAFPQWRGAKVLAALSQNTYWFLILRSDLKDRLGDLSVLKGLRIGAAPLVDLSLKRLIVEAGLDEARDDVTIGPVPGAFLGADMNFGVAAAKALEADLIDGFWANGMGAEVSIRSGAGVLALDARRGDGPAGSEHYTFPALITTDELIRETPDVAAAAVRALARTQAALRSDPGLAEQVGRKRFPDYEASLISELVARDAPFYDAAVAPDAVQSMVRFQLDMGLLAEPVGYEDVVATRFDDLWPLSGGTDSE